MEVSVRIAACSKTPQLWTISRDELFHAALERPPETRSQFLGDACGTDSDLRRVIERLTAIQNSSCSISGGGSSAVLSGNNFRPTLNVTFKQAFAGATNSGRHASRVGQAGGLPHLRTWSGQ